ncbi:MAG: dihydrolipoyl dehydrogenase [Dehalococcoidia bacterium]|nr:dihydrolipoyl dehydrogenase [Dehalococcoidia bacterium]
MADYDVAIIGGGPGGYVAAIRAAQLEKSVVLFERDRVGGLCLNWGCIPSKAILRNADVVNLFHEAESWGVSTGEVTADFGKAIDRSRKVVEKLVGGVEQLLKSNGVTTISAEAQFEDAHTIVADGERYSVGATIIATGAKTKMLPGVEVDGEVILTSREALERREVPKRVVIIGGGAVGVEFAYTWATYGAEVSIVEMLPRLVPNEDDDIGRQLERSFKQQGITSYTGTKVESVERSGDGAKVQVSKDGESQTLEADVVLVAIGFDPHTENLGLENAGVETDRGFVTIDEHMQTNVTGVYAVGDVTGKLMLAHVAQQQGVVAAEHIAGKNPPPLDYRQLPRATFCQPQVGSVGYTEKEAKEAGFDVRAGRFPFSALGKSIATGETDGFVKVVADTATGQVLGLHMIGHDVNDLLGEATISAMLEATTIELGFAVHAHPTLAEAIKEAALAADGEAIHIAPRRSSAAARGKGAKA